MVWTAVGLVRNVVGMTCCILAGCPYMVVVNMVGDRLVDDHPYSSDIAVVVVEVAAMDDFGCICSYCSLVVFGSCSSYEH